jgi:hypothetical protein
MADDRTITGGTVITLADQLRGVYWSNARLYKICAVVLVVAWLLILLPELTISSNSDLDAGGFTLLNPVYFIPLLFLFWFGLIAFGFRRFSAEQKRLAFEIDAQHVLVRDGTGTEVSISWSIVRRVVESRHGFAVMLKPAGVRWVPKRAFAPARIASLRDLFQEILGARAVRLSA